MIAEWNIRQEDAAAAARRPIRMPGKHGRVVHAPTPAPTAPTATRRPQSPRAAMALLGNAQAAVTPDAAAFWFGKGLIHVE